MIVRDTFMGTGWNNIVIYRLFLIPPTCTYPTLTCLTPE